MSTVGYIAVSKGSSKIAISKSLAFLFFLIVNFMLTYRVLLVSVLSAVELVLEAAYTAFLLAYLLYRIAIRSFSGNLSLNQLEVYLLMLFLLPIIPAIGAWNTFGQPIFWGLVSFLDFYLIIGGLLVYNMLREGIISIKTVEDSLVVVSWLNLILFYYMSLFTNPAQYLDTGLAGSQAAKGGDVYYRFNMFFMFFGTIYYFIKSLDRKNYAYLLACVLFLVYIVFFRLDRTTILVTFAGMAGYFFLHQSVRQQFRHILYLLLPLAFVIVSSLVLAPDIWDQYIEMFADIYYTLMGGTNSEGKESIRIYEMAIATEYIDRHPIIGNGRISNFWKPGGYSSFLGFFYASDVGIFGQLFMYGIPGTLILYGQFALGLFFVLTNKMKHKSIFYSTLVFVYLALFLDSLTNGFITIYAAQYVTTLILIYYLARHPLRT